MIILTIRTDSPQAEIGLYDDDKKLKVVSWLADRQLAETIHKQILEVLKSQQLDWHDVEAVVGYQGPGSFTGLRIGLTVANSLAVGLSVPIVGVNSKAQNWSQTGIKRLLAGHNDKLVMPEYGSEPNITKPRH
jgi:tRNA threonylcarbamoyladenosine biosynthesis protein TsaB